MVMLIMDNLAEEQHKSYELTRIPLRDLNNLDGLGFKLIPLRQDSTTPNIPSTNIICNDPDYWSEEKLRDNHHLFHNVATVFGKSHIKDQNGDDLYLNAFDIDSENVFTRSGRYISKSGKDVYLIGDACNSTFVTKTRKPFGRHIYWFSHRQNKPIRTADCKFGCEFEIKTDNSTGHCTLPPGMHRDDPNFHYYNIGQNRIVVNDKLYDVLLDLLSDFIRDKSSYRNHNASASINEPFNEIDSSDSLRIASVVAIAYRNGSRHDIIFQLSSFLCRGNLRLGSAETVVRDLCKITGDEETDNRLDVLHRTYYKAKNGDPITGSNGLTEILERVVGIETANQIVTDISQILNKFQNPVLKQLDDNIRNELLNHTFETISYDPLTLVVAHATKKQILTCKLKKPENIRYGDVIINAVPQKIVRYVNPLDNSQIKHKIIFATPSGESFTTLPKTTEEIVSELSARGLSYKPRVAEESLNAIINGAQRAQRVNIVRQIDKPGFYYVDGKIVSSDIDVSKPSAEDIRACAKFLSELIERSKHPEMLVTEIKWGVLAPFSYVLKQLSDEGSEKWLPWLYLDGHTQTSKTTDGKIALSIYGKQKNKFSLASADNVARFGDGIGQDTFPRLIDEAKLDPKIHGNLIETIKHAVQGQTARKRLTKKSEPIYIPALSSCVLTSNYQLPSDPALRRRFLNLHYPKDDKPTEDEIRQFHIFWTSGRNALGTLGDFAAHYLLSKQELITNSSNDWQTIAKIILGEFHKAADLALPGWMDMFCVGNQIEDVEVEQEQIIRNFFQKRINDIFSRNYKLLASFEDQKTETTIYKYKLPQSRLDFCLDNQLIPFMRRKSTTNEIFITRDILQEFRNNGIDFIQTFTDLGRLLKAEIKPAKVGGEQARPLIIRIEKLMEFINPDLTETEST
jgi:hypothetical protein